MVCVFISVLLIAADHHRKLDPLRSALSLIVYPIHYAVSLPVNLSLKAFESLASYAELVRENRRLRDELLVLQSRLLKFSALEKENIRLRALLDTSFKLGEQVLVAELLSVNLLPYEHVVMVNKGSRFGIYRNQPVVDANGVVGQVFRAYPLNAEVILITDPSHAIPIQVNRNGLRTIAVGSGRIDRLDLPYLPNNADIKQGDLLVTSGLGGIFPQGYPVATVSSIIHKPDSPFAKISAEPAAKLNRSRELLMVWTNSEPIPLPPGPATRSEETASHDAH